jgi:hypothetical protein
MDAGFLQFLRGRNFTEGAYNALGDTDKIALVTAHATTLLGAARVAVPPPAQLPPLYESAVYVLCDSVENGQTPAATCFAISPRHILTCYHCLVEGVARYTIALSVERNAKGILEFNEGFRSVTLKYRNKLSDWAILEVEGPEDLPEFIPISLDEVRADRDVKIFYCPVARFTDGPDDLLSVDIVWAKTLRGTTHHLRFNTGLFRGSSGAPVVLRNGCAVAFHQEAGNKARTMPAREEMAQMDMVEVIDVISDSVHSEVYARYANSRSIEIRKCPKLVNTLRRINVIV